MADDVALSIEGLSVSLPGGGDRRFAVEDASLTVKRGEIVCVVGESGSGKSVLSAAVMGAVPGSLRVTAGRIRLAGVDVTGMPEPALRKLRGDKVAMIFQEPMAALNPAIPVGRQVEEMFEIHRPEMPEAERKANVLALLESVHLPDPARLAERLPHQLSGGQCQRIVIAMALALTPALLIADEPTTALDVTTQAQILKLVRELRDEHAHGILFITHDFGVVAEIADRIAVMRHGRIVEMGTAADVLERPTHAYTKALLAAVPKGDVAAEARGPAAEPHLRMVSLFKSYRHVRALDDVSVTVPRGSTTAVVGESGSGKSTLARVAIRLIEPSSGEVFVGDTDFGSPSIRVLRPLRRLVQMIFQDPHGSLNPRRTVRDVLLRAGLLGGLSRKEADAQAKVLIEQVGLPQDALARLPTAFSGGQRQRIGIARALAMRPEVIIADECVSALDVSIQRQVLELLAALKRERGLTLLFITHDLRVAAEIADHVVVMRRGQVVEEGSARQILSAPRQAYTQALVAAIPGRGLGEVA